MTLKLKAKKIWRGLTDIEMDSVLWGCTNYPIGDEQEVLAALKDVYERSGGDLLIALNEADQQRSTGKRGS